MNQFYIDDEDNIPDELVKANEERKIIQCNTIIGWIDLDIPVDFRNSVTYRVKP